MATMRKYRKTLGVGMVFLAILACGGVGLRVVAAIVGNDVGFEDRLFVDIFDPTSIVGAVYTPGGVVPASIPVGIYTYVERSAGEPAMPAIDSVVTVVGGDLNELNGQVTGDVFRTTASLIESSVGLYSADYVAVVNLAALDFQPVTRGARDMFVVDTIRTLVTAGQYYEAAEIGVDIEVRDLADVDSDGNLIPDATALLDRDLFLLNDDGTVTLVTALDGLDRGFSSNEVAYTYQSVGGPVEVVVYAPILEDLWDADIKAYGIYDLARLVVTIAPDVDLLTDVGTVAPFDIAGAPAPAGLFIRATILLADLDVRGSPTWVPVGTPLPGGLDFEVELYGPGIDAALESATGIGVYSYAPVAYTQDGENITADATDGSWSLEEDDSDLPARGSPGTEADFRNPGIWASNIIPAPAGGGGGGGDDGLCFIATAAYGTPMATQIGSLRAVRDEYLIGNPLGAAFVDSYYRMSPPIAWAMSENAALRQGVRVALAPVIAVSGWLLASPGSFAAAGIAVMLIGAAAARKFRRPYETFAKK